MLYVATNRLSFVVIGLIAAGDRRSGTWARTSHIHARVETWLHPLDPHAVPRPLGSYQVANAMFAQAAGGMFGQGFGQVALTLPAADRCCPPRRRT